MPSNPPAAGMHEAEFAAGAANVLKEWSRAEDFALEGRTDAAAPPAKRRYNLQRKTRASSCALPGLRLLADLDHYTSSGDSRLLQSTSHERSR